MTFGTLGTHPHIPMDGQMLNSVRGPSLNARIPAEVIVGPLKEVQRCFVGNSMHLREMGHGSLLPIDQAGAIRANSLCRRRLDAALSPMPAQCARNGEESIPSLELRKLSAQQAHHGLAQLNVEKRARDACDHEIDLNRI